MQVCPQLKYLPKRTLIAALYTLALSSMMTGHFPPNSKIQGVKFLAASIATSLPVVVEPVKQIISNGNFVIVFAT